MGDFLKYQYHLKSVIDEYAENGINKIDLVYLWVDGNDRRWKDKKNLWIKKLNKKLPDQVGCDARFRDNEELKYSLRSVEKFVPWINHIFIVTDGQVPKWINQKNKKITIVDHKEIMPKDALPTFNSMALAACVHNIQNLSEYFLYANDDCFFGDYLTPEYFFDKDGNPNIFVKRHQFKKNEIENHSIGMTDNSYATYVLNSIKITYDNFKRKYNCYPSHVITAEKKSAHINFSEKFPDIFYANIYSKFRDKNNINDSALALYENCMGRNNMYFNKTMKGEIFRYNHITGKYPIRYYLNRIFKDKGYETIGGSTNVIEKIIKTKPKLFCINDTEKTTEDQCLKNQKFMMEFFPDKSKFEK